MAQLPSFRRIVRQDYDPKYQDLIDTLSVSLNQGIEVLYDLLNGKLSIKDNFASTIKEIDVEVDANGKPKTKTIIKKTSTDRTEGLWVLRVQNLTNSNVYPSATPLISFTETTDSIIVDNITSLPIGYIFRIKIVAMR
tara:strand:- start:153 stop:566 length:414 start_codon:yes stop_codon:yes gene_type:complete